LEPLYSLLIMLLKQLEYAIASISGGGLDDASGTFAIDSHSGVLTTRLQLDRERTQVRSTIADCVIMTYSDVNMIQHVKLLSFLI
jgi:hypothetical protein